MTAIKLTKLETEILAHRLEVPECISESIAECEELAGLKLETYDDRIDDACREILTTVRVGKLPEATPEGMSKLWTYILMDAVEGSTYYGSAKGEGNRRASTVFRAGESLAEKVTQWCKANDPEFGSGELLYPDY